MCVCVCVYTFVESGQQLDRGIYLYGNGRQNVEMDIENGKRPLPILIYKQLYLASSEFS